MEKKTPVISIITVVFNGADLLEGTIQSVINQSYPHIEYIIVDGKSKDNTFEIIQKYKHQITKWISEPDKGLYDAMNKGLKMATGDFVWFMNAGDRIFKKDTVEKIVENYRADTDILYGEVMLVNDERKHLGTRSELTTQKLPHKLDWKSLKFGMVVCHQGILVGRSIANFYGENNLAADIDWVISALKKAKLVTRCDLIAAEYLQGGVSKQRHQQSLKDRYAILKSHYGWLPNIWNHFLIVLRAVWFKIFRIGKEQY